MLRGRRRGNRWPTVIFLASTAAAILWATTASFWLLGIQIQPTAEVGGVGAAPALRFGGLNVTVALFVAVLITAGVDVIVGIFQLIFRRRRGLMTGAATPEQEPVPTPDAQRLSNETPDEAAETDTTPATADGEDPAEGVIHEPLTSAA
jgi:hypothetical protein